MENKNEELARFMGYKTGEELGKNNWKNYWFHPDGSHYEHLHFDSNWNLLMQVVEKIDNLRTLSSVEESYFYCVELYGSGARIFDGKTGGDEVIVEIISGGSWIETTYKLVFEFIEWYNKHKK
jgi:hypothetical protein